MDSGAWQMRQAKFGTALGLMLVGLSLSSVKAQDKAILPRWQSDKVFTKQFASAIKVEGYSVQPPKKYQKDQTDIPGGKVISWIGAARDDGSLTAMFLDFLPVIPEKEVKEHNLEWAATQILAGMNSQRKDWKPEKAETGMVNGLTFVRIRWSGFDAEWKRKIQGVIYVMLDGDKPIALTGQDAFPESQKTLPMIEACILTFKKQ